MIMKKNIEFLLNVINDKELEYILRNASKIEANDTTLIKKKDIELTPEQFEKFKELLDKKED